VVAVTGKVTTGAPHFVEVGHQQPADLTADQHQAVCALAVRAVRALGVSAGAAHVEIMVTREGPRLIEVGARLGGDYIASHLTPLSTGVSLIDAALDAALGHVADISAHQRGGSAIRYLTPTGTGMVRSVEGLAQAQSVPGVVEVRALKGEGYHMSGLRSSSDRVGYVIAEGRNAAEAVRRCEEAIAAVHVTTQSGPAGPGAWAADCVHPGEDT
jgi:biotin carboxylase